MSIPRILLCAGASGSGKTLLTCGILQALKNRGLKPVSFKCGPDYIDPMFHTKVIGTKSRNLDTFFAGEEVIRYLLSANSRDMDIAVMEGVMGYYDGAAGTTTRGSAYELAEITGTPAVLIVNCKGMSLSIAALIKGFAEYRENSHIAGVILNNMSEMLYRKMKPCIEKELNLPVIGYVPKVTDCVIESRHLGLVLPEEIEDFQCRLEKLAGILEKTLDLDLLLRLAGTAKDLPESSLEEIDAGFSYRLPERVRIGIAEDEAFCFIYEDNLQLLKQMGAELVPFSPIREEDLPPDLDGLIFYGGYPELFARQLSENEGMKQAVRRSYDKGIPVLAECGGFMYLHDSFEDMEGRNHGGVGLIRGCAYKTEKLSRFGYISLTAKEGESAFGRDIGVSPAHEFHYFDSENCGSSFSAKKPFSDRKWSCIHAGSHLLAGFPHFYYYGNPKLPAAFLQQCLQYKKRREKE